MDAETDGMFVGDLVCQDQNGKAYLGNVTRVTRVERKTQQDGIKFGKVYTVRWHPDGTSRPETDVWPVDRPIKLGQGVRKRNKSLIGKVLRHRYEVCLRVIPTNEVIQNVPGTNLSPLPSQISRGKLISLNNWVGIVLKVDYEITVKTADGLECTFNEQTFKLLDNEDDDDPLNPPCIESGFDSLDFYVGQRMKGPIKNFHFSRWAQGGNKVYPKFSQNTSIVIHVEVDSYQPVLITVKWLFSLCPEEPEWVEPSPQIDRSNFSKMTLLTPETRWEQLISINQYYRHLFKEEDVATKNINEWRKELATLMIPKNNYPFDTFVEQTSKEEQVVDMDEYSVVSAETILVTSTISVAWQDGSVEDDILSTELVPIIEDLNFIFFINDFVVAKMGEIENQPKHALYGCIKEIANEKNTVSVAWIGYSKDESNRTIIMILRVDHLSPSKVLRHPVFKFKVHDIVQVVDGFDPEDNLSKAGKITHFVFPARINVLLFNNDMMEAYPEQLILLDQTMFNLEESE